jgi:DNA-binding PadR family transcriptional regulator
MYELIILGLLIRGAAHGYLIASIISDIIGPYARLSNGRLYPLLAKLEQEGLIVARTGPAETHRGERHLRAYDITDAGRKRFHDLMMDTTSNPGEYQKFFLQKVPMLHYLKPSERLHLIDHYINYCQAHVLHMMTEAEDLASRGATNTYMSRTQFDATLSVMQHRADEWRLELEWAGQLREKELACSEALDVKADTWQVEQKSEK